MRKFSLIFLSALTISLCTMLYFSPGTLLTPIANFLIVDENPHPADAVVVLNTGMGIYERLVEAADLYNKGFVDQIIINGNRKNELVKELDEMGLTHCCPWDEGWIRILNLSGVPRKAILSIPAEDVYDTMSEATVIGEILADRNFKKLLITTSKTHTQRAIYIWKELYRDQFHLTSIASKRDPFDATRWWQEGKFAKQLLYEYGSWVFMFWKKCFETSYEINPDKEIVFYPVFKCLDPQPEQA